ncbi:hypothetical protein OIU76_005841 [Salix suchowensis]|nr:hypothetical protein OIU76_005841 [Salix suchowensis]
MGGGGAEHGHGAEGAHSDFRAKVWSMSGGPNCRPKHWRRNTAIAMFGVFLICIPIAMKSAELEILKSSVVDGDSFRDARRKSDGFGFLIPKLLTGLFGLV